MVPTSLVLVQLIFFDDQLGKVRGSRQGLVGEHPTASVDVVLQASLLDDVAGLRRDAETRHPREHLHDPQGEDIQVGLGVQPHQRLLKCEGIILSRNILRPQTTS